MRLNNGTALFFATSGLIAAFACGGPKTPADATKSADDGGGASSIDGDAGPAPDDAGPATTTTATLDDSGAGQKLPPIATASASDGGAVAARDGGASDPGRGMKDIEAIVKAHRDEARKCYDDAVKAHPGIEGDLVIHWVLAPDGKISKIELNTARSQITEPSVVNCVIDVIKKISFAPSPRGMESNYNYPFNFHPRGSR